MTLSLRFGSLHQQISLHAGVLYVNPQTIPSCSTAPGLQHDPYHLDRSRTSPRDGKRQLPGRSHSELH